MMSFAVYNNGCRSENTYTFMPKFMSLAPRCLSVALDENQMEAIMVKQEATN